MSEEIPAPVGGWAKSVVAGVAVTDKDTSSYVRVLRVIEYFGPPDQVKSTIDKSISGVLIMNDMRITGAVLEDNGDVARAQVIADAVGPCLEHAAIVDGRLAQLTIATCEALGWAIPKTPTECVNAAQFARAALGTPEGLLRKLTCPPALRVYFTSPQWDLFAGKLRSIAGDMLRASAVQSRSAVSLIERDGLILCVWNKRYNGWALPGGKVEPGESLEGAQARELLEETGLRTVTRTLVYDAPHKTQRDDTGGIDLTDNKRPRGQSHVFVYRVKARGEETCEEGCPLKWLPLAEFLRMSPFAEFYKTAFATINQEPSNAQD